MEKNLLADQTLTQSNEHPVRLYEISNATGRTIATEIPNFTQVRTFDSYLEKNELFLYFSIESIQGRSR